MASVAIVVPVYRRHLTCEERSRCGGRLPMGRHGWALDDRAFWQEHMVLPPTDLDDPVDLS